MLTGVDRAVAMKLDVHDVVVIVPDVQYASLNSQPHPQLYHQAARLYKPVPFKTIQLLLLLATVVMVRDVDNAAAIELGANDVGAASSLIRL